ncbi:importin subunit beta-1 [Prunus yedoensis var. nudiflora]|uniref:Importin subunit beta-1 n=1 Tax=Prunus yedoensis var. nudiflora TaxID=2094558 RepID=A0A314Z761_PRUYE|nr:importin subunit beta-1 [Prunus yedoensis var. nudiflora]
MLLETLLKQEENLDQDHNIWNIAMAGRTCLKLVARTVGDAILPLVMPFVEANIAKPDWHCREAAAFAFGSIIEGPTTEQLSGLVHAGLDFLLTLMKDENNHVKDTTAWTLSCIFELLHHPARGFSVISADNLPRVVEYCWKARRMLQMLQRRSVAPFITFAKGMRKQEPLPLSLLHMSQPSLNVFFPLLVVQMGMILD